MKKVLLSLATATMLSFPAMALADGSDIKVLVNQQLLQFNQPPVIVNGTTLVPLRSIFEALGATVNWDQASQTVTATKGDTTIKLTIGQQTALKNSDQVQLSVPGTIIKGSTMVPTRFVAESFGETVDWNGDTMTVSIYDASLGQNKAASTAVSKTPVNPSKQQYWDLAQPLLNSLKIDGNMLSGDFPPLPDGYAYYIVYNGIREDGSNLGFADPSEITNTSPFPFDYGFKGVLSVRIIDSNTHKILGSTIVKIPSLESKNN